MLEQTPLFDEKLSFHYQGLDRLSESPIIAGGNVKRLETKPEGLGGDKILVATGMTLKEAATFYAMYMNFAERDKLFKQLDFLLDPEDWHDEDKVPEKASFISFLKWTVATRRFDWTSLGFDQTGSIQVAFVNGSNQFTAAFAPSDRVNWASQIKTEDGFDYSAGQTPLRTFATTSIAMLDRL